MTTKDKALAIANTLFRPYRETLGQLSHKELMMTLEHVVEQHEAFRQEVSFALKTFKDGNMHTMHDYLLEPFIIPTAKPDPLLDIVERLGGEWKPEEYVKEIRAALEAAGFEIREKNDD